MSFQEKAAWVDAATTLSACAIYLYVVVPRLSAGSAEQVAYEWPLIAAVVAAIVATIVGQIVISACNPREADQSDERDAVINRSGGYVSSFVLGAGCLGALSLTMLKFDHFWTANALFTSFMLAELTSSGVKLFRYRVGC